MRYEVLRIAYTTSSEYQEYDKGNCTVHLVGESRNDVGNLLSEWKTRGMPASNLGRRLMRLRLDDETVTLKREK